MPVGGDLAGVKVQQVATYGDCSLAVSTDGQVFGWGNSEYLQLASVTEATQVKRTTHTNKNTLTGVQIPEITEVIVHRITLNVTFILRFMYIKYM